jgi:hypothetical protein
MQAATSITTDARAIALVRGEQLYVKIEPITKDTKEKRGNVRRSDAH